MRIRAAVLEEFGQPLDVTEVEQTPSSPSAIAGPIANPLASS
jgi:hypothetical protein